MEAAGDSWGQLETGIIFDQFYFCEFVVSRIKLSGDLLHDEVAEPRSQKEKQITGGEGEQTAHLVEARNADALK